SLRTSPVSRSRYQIVPDGENVNPAGSLSVLTVTTLTDAATVGWTLARASPADPPAVSAVASRHVAVVSTRRLRILPLPAACGSMSAVTTVPPSTFGIPALRSEDPRFLRGQGRYLENISVEGSLRAVFVRSIFPHAELHGVEGLDEARAMPGVVAVFTADDVGIPPQPPAGVGEGPRAGRGEPVRPGTPA